MWSGNKTKATYVDAIEQIVVVLLVLLEDPDIFEHLLVDLDSIIVSNRVFTEEVKYDPMGSLKRDMLASKGTTANSVRLILPLFVASSKGEFVNEVHGRGALTISHHFRLEINIVVFTNAVDVVLRACMSQLLEIYVGGIPSTREPFRIWIYRSDP